MNFVAAILYAVSSSTVLALALAFLRGGLNRGSAAFALGTGLLVASLTLWQGRHRESRTRPPSAPEWAAIVAFTLVSLRIFLWLVFVEGDDIKVLSPNNLGDLSLHLTYVRYLASGVAFWPDNPIFTGGKLTYPIGVDLFHSLLVLLGLNVFRMFIWMGVIGAALTGAALWRWGRGFALFGFLANGGLAGFALFYTRHVVDFQTELAWKSFALALFATQRGLLFALPAGLLLLSSWRVRLLAPHDEGWRLPRWGEVLLYASLPLFHFHTFLFLSVLLGLWFVAVPAARRELLVLVGASFVPATALVYLITGGFKGASMLGWKPGWMWDDEGFLAWFGAHFHSLSSGTAGSALWPVNSGVLRVIAQWFGAHFHGSSPIATGLTFWLVNFGVLPIVTTWLVVVLCGRRGNPRARLFVFPALAVFLVCCFVKFAPWEWDNTKLMIWSYLVLLPFLWSELLARWPAWARQLTVTALFFSGFVSTLGGIDAQQTGYPIASRAELDGMADALRGIPVTERFAGAPTYNHPLLLSGRKMVLGYLGHVHSHGLAWQEPSEKLNALLNGEEHWEQLAAELDARYLFWGRYEDDAYKDSAQPWKQTKRVVASGDWGAIYDLQTASAAGEGAPMKPE